MRAYNIWCLSGNRWTNAGGQDYRNPARWTLGEAQAQFLHHFGDSDPNFVIIEMDDKSQPILPKCRMR